MSEEDPRVGSLHAQPFVAVTGSGWLAWRLGARKLQIMARGAMPNHPVWLRQCGGRSEGRRCPPTRIGSA